MTQTYSLNEYNKENMARAIGKSLPVSFKQSIEICNYIRNKKLNTAKKWLNEVAAGKRAVPFRRFIMDMGHKAKIGPGRFPAKTSSEILNLIDQVEANAQFKGLNTSNLTIIHINANKGATISRSGRKRGMKAKRTNIEIVVKESAEKK